MIVTGASQGIGRELAVQAAAAGAKVVAAARSKPLLDELAAEAKGTLVTVVADVTVAADRQKLIDAATQHFGGLDVLVNNAGIGATGHFADADEARLRSIFEVNFFAVTELTRLAIPLLKLGTTPAVVNVSSLVGKRGFPGRSEYSASKFAIQGWSEAIRAELAVYGIDVLVINPGLTQTNFPKNMLERKSKLQVDHMRGMTAAQRRRSRSASSPAAPTRSPSPGRASCTSSRDDSCRDSSISSRRSASNGCTTAPVSRDAAAEREARPRAPLPRRG